MAIISRERFLPDEDSAVNRGFEEYNSSQHQESFRHPLALAHYTADGQLAGGLDGYVFFDWLSVSRLWVADRSRGRGVGTELLLAAEQIARELSCVGSTLSTYDFQARPFYAKLGYEVFGVLADNPRGRERFFMRKVF